MKPATWVACIAVVLAPICSVATHDRIVDYKIDQAFADLDMIRAAVQRSAEAHRRLPTESEGLESLTVGDGRQLDKLQSDPWSGAYVYRRVPGNPGFVVYSRGLDGVDDHGAADDVTTRDKTYRCETYYDECTGSLPWWRDVALGAMLLAGLAWLIFSAAIGMARRRRAS